MPRRKNIIEDPKPIPKNWDENRLEEFVPGFKVRLSDLFLHEIFEKAQNDTDLERILCYILLLYNSNSKLVRTYDDILARKKYAAKLVSVASMSQKVWPASYKNMPKVMGNSHTRAAYTWGMVINGECEEVNAYIQYYLNQVQHNKQFRQLIALEKVFDEYTEMLETKVDGDDQKRIVEAIQKKTTVQKTLEQTINDIEVLKKKIYVDYYEEAERGMLEVRMRIRPETYAVKKSDRP